MRQKREREREGRSFIVNKLASSSQSQRAKRDIRIWRGNHQSMKLASLAKPKNCMTSDFGTKIMTNTTTLINHILKNKKKVNSAIKT